MNAQSFKNEGGAMDEGSSGLKGKNLIVYNAVKACTDEVGINIRELRSKLSAMPQHELT